MLPVRKLPADQPRGEETEDEHDCYRGGKNPDDLAFVVLHMFNILFADCGS